MRAGRAEKIRIQSREVGAELMRQGQVVGVVRGESVALDVVDGEQQQRAVRVDGREREFLARAD